MGSVLPEPERYIVPLAAYLALVAYGSTQSDPAGRAESEFLSLLIAGVLAVMAALGAAAPGGRRAPELPVTALLATATVWIAYQGPPRGAVVSLVLIVGFAVVAARALLDERGRLRSGEGLELAVTAPLALGVQLLMRGDLLLVAAGDARLVVSLLGLPVAAAAATSVLASDIGRRRALLAAGVVVVLAPGWTTTSTLALVALAAGSYFSDGTRPKALRWAAVAVLALLPFWNLPKGLLFVIGAMAVAAPSMAGASMLLVGVVAVALIFPQAHGPVVAVRWWLGAVLLVPAAVLAGPAGRWQLRVGALVALAAAMVSKAPEAMAGGLAVAVLAAPSAGVAATLQRIWCAVLVAGTTLLAAYPWVREDPRGDLLGLLGFENEVSALLAALVGVAGLGYAFDRFGDEIPRWLRRPVLIACLFLTLGVGRQVVAVSGTTVLIDSYQPVTLAAADGAWQGSFGGPVRGLALDSHLTGGVPIGPGLEVAAIELQTTDGSTIAEWSLRVGRETGEWAASRPDLASHIGFRAPASWISYVAPGGGFFAHRFRARFDLTEALTEVPGTTVTATVTEGLTEVPGTVTEVPGTVTAVTAATVTEVPGTIVIIVIRPTEHLPPEARLSIYRLELRR